MNDNKILILPELDLIMMTYLDPLKDYNILIRTNKYYYEFIKNNKVYIEFDFV